MQDEFELPEGIVPAAGLVLDIGGEGRHPVAWNLNQRRHGSGILAERPIARLILARADAIPLQAGSVDLVIVERTPLRRRTLEEINRVVKADGNILLRHAITPAGDPHRVALAILRGRAARRQFAHRGCQIQETMIRRSGMGHPGRYDVDAWAAKRL